MKFCTGCGHQEDHVFGGKPCCPDCRYKTIDEILNERSECIGRIAELDEQMLILRRMVRIACGLASALPQFSDKHPEDVYELVVKTELESR